MKRKRIVAIRTDCVALVVNTASRGGRRIERLLPRMASRTQAPIPPSALDSASL
jgi:hypothetical protein